MTDPEPIIERAAEVGHYVRSSKYKAEKVHAPGGTADDPEPRCGARTDGEWKAHPVDTWPDSFVEGHACGWCASLLTDDPVQTYTGASEKSVLRRHGFEDEAEALDE